MFLKYKHLYCAKHKGKLQHLTACTDDHFCAATSPARVLASNIPKALSLKLFGICDLETLEKNLLFQMCLVIL